MSKEQYLKMQKRQYDSEASRWSVTNKDPVVGWYQFHEQSPLYDEQLFRDIDTTGKVALDFGCGPGRCIVRFNDRFARIDGVDISQTNLDNALLNLEDANIEYKGTLTRNEGGNVPTPDDAYDVVFSVICLQHIACHDIRISIMKDIFRTLKSGGTFTFQMGGGNRPNSASYYENQWDAPGTNGSRDVNVPLDEHMMPLDLINDLEEIGFENINVSVTEPIKDLHDVWLWVKGEKP